jgi:hypothetical protein
MKGNPFTFAAPSLLGIGRVSGTGELDGKKTSLYYGPWTVGEASSAWDC